VSSRQRKEINFGHLEKLKFFEVPFYISMQELESKFAPGSPRRKRLPGTKIDFRTDNGAAAEKPGPAFFCGRIQR